MPIYTRTGDTGTTALFGGRRVLKCEELVDVYGSIDEVNSWIGHIASQLENFEAQTFFHLIQSDLFTIGSHMVGRKTDLRHLDKRVEEMEARIDVMEKDLPKLTNFILPGGSDLGVHTHIARAICRRVERQIVALSQKQAIDHRIIKYFNRLSDLLFVLARFINKQTGKPEIVWSGIKK